MKPCLLDSHVLSATDALPDMTPADQRHTPVVIGDRFSDIDEDDQEDEAAASQSSDIDAEDETHARAADVSVPHAVYEDVAVDITADVAAPIADIDGTFGAAATRSTVAQQAGAQETAGAAASTIASAITIIGAPATGAEGTLHPGAGPADTEMLANAPVTTKMGTPTAAATVALAAAAVAIHNTVGPVHRRGTRAGGDSASHFSVTAPQLLP